MNYLDGFSGYGGFHKAFEDAGWVFDKCYYSEIDKHAIANYSYNYPNSIYAGSIDTICESGIITELDLFTFGWPCQDNSIAGKRKGQSSGTRIGLLYEAVKIINKYKPRNFVAENVAGLLSVNKGIDIVESFRLLAYLNESCPQYDIEMQLLNTRWFLPQNRERLFFVGHLRDGSSRQVFPIGEDTAAFQESSIVVEGTTIGDDCTRYGERDVVYGTSGIMGCMSSTDYKQPKQILVPSATVKGYEIANAGDSINLAVPDSKTRRGRVGKGVAQTLDTSCNQGVLIKGPEPKILTQKRTEFGKKVRKEYEAGQMQYQRKDMTSFEPRPDNISNTLTSVQKDNLLITNEPINSVRRLTPVECERLQGLPDDWTKYGNYEGQTKEISDTQRYRLCGNGVSVPVVKAIAQKLKQVNQI